QPRGDLHELRRERRRDARAHGRARRIEAHGDPARAIAETHGAAVFVAIDDLDPRDRAATGKAHELARREPGSIIEAERDEIGALAFAVSMPQRGRWAAEALFEDRVEAPHAREARGERNLGERHAGVLEELLREREAPRLREARGRDAELGLH